MPAELYQGMLSESEAVSLGTNSHVCKRMKGSYTEYTKVSVFYSDGQFPRSQAEAFHLNYCSLLFTGDAGNCNEGLLCAKQMLHL